MVITTEDVGATMVVATTSEAIDLPLGSAAVATWYSTVTVGSMAAARAWSGGSTRRWYL
jgi:hypothetical protein